MHCPRIRRSFGLLKLYGATSHDNPLDEEGPPESYEGANGLAPSNETRPCVGLMPNVPQ